MTSPAPRLTHPLERRSTAVQWWRASMGLLLIAVAGTMLVRRYEWGSLSWWLAPLLVFGMALVLVWSPLENAVQLDARRPSLGALIGRDGWLRMGVGVLLAIAAIWWMVAAESDVNPLVRAIAVPIAVVVALVLLLAPWWLRLLRQVGIERERRVREFERAEIAAHLHDSVLQTLTLIRAKADDPEAVARLARAQERDLRAYLYQDRRSTQESIASALGAAVAEIEDAHAVEVEVVTVGDAPTTPELAAVVQAVREAVANAARHGQAPIAVYAEVTARAVEVFVRDGGPGFDPAAVPEGRLGIRESIIGRVVRHGGSAEITSRPGGRTEVALTMPREEQP